MKRTFLVFFLLILCVTVLSAETFRYVAPHVTAQPPWLNKVAVFNNGEAAADFTVIIRDTDGVSCSKFIQCAGELLPGAGPAHRGRLCPGGR